MPIENTLTGIDKIPSAPDAYTGFSVVAWRVVKILSKIEANNTGDQGISEAFLRYTEKLLTDIGFRRDVKRILEESGDNFLTPNLAFDWSVMSGGTAEALGYNPTLFTTIQQLNKSPQTCLFLGSGNNASATMSRSGFSVEGIGDYLYVDVIYAFCTLLSRIGILTHKPKLVNYIAHSFLEILRKKYRGNNGNQYGQVEANSGPFSMTLTRGEVDTVFRKVWNIKENTGATSTMMYHGEFERGKNLAEELGSIRGELGNIDLTRLRIQLHKTLGTEDRDHMFLSEIFPFGCYPFRFTQGRFDKIKEKYAPESFDLIISKRAESHLPDNEFYQNLIRVARLLKSGGTFLTDGIRESYSRVIRGDIPGELWEIPGIQIYAIMNPHCTGTEQYITSLMICKGPVSELYIKHLSDGHSYVPLESRDHWGILMKNWRGNTLNNARKSVRKKIGCGRFDLEVHHLIDMHIDPSPETGGYHPLKVLIRNVTVYLIKKEIRRHQQLKDKYQEIFSPEGESNISTKVESLLYTSTPVPMIISQILTEIQSRYSS